MPAYKFVKPSPIRSTHAANAFSDNFMNPPYMMSISEIAAHPAISIDVPWRDNFTTHYSMHSASGLEKWTAGFFHF